MKYVVNIQDMRPDEDIGSKKEGRLVTCLIVMNSWPNESGPQRMAMGERCSPSTR